jgi:hypothetical protein
MGDEIWCTASYGGQESEGKAHLESTELRFRGDFRLTVPIDKVTRVEAADGRLRLTFGGETAELALGPRAERWAAKIRNPRGLLDKLGVTPGARVGLLGVTDADFRQKLAVRGAEIWEGEFGGDLDFIFLQADRPDDLEKLGRLVPYLKPNGGVWIISPKGAASPVPQALVMAEVKAAGLVDVKVSAFSDSHTALKAVIPVARRQAGRARG